jgi:hypothetical protein
MACPPHWRLVRTTPLPASSLPPPCLTVLNCAHFPLNASSPARIHSPPQALDRWENRLEALFEGQPYDALDAALSDTISSFPVHIQPFRWVGSAVSWAGDPTREKSGLRRERQGQQGAGDGSAVLGRQSYSVASLPAPHHPAHPAWFFGIR